LLDLEFLSDTTEGGYDFYLIKGVDLSSYSSLI